MDENKELSPLHQEIQLEVEQRKQLVLAIQKARIEKHLTFADIVKGCEENGEPVSMTSVRRVCTPGGENQSYRYDTTLRPIARFVLGLDDAPMPDTAEEDGPASNELLRIVVSIKEDIIADMRQGIQQREDELTRVRTEYESRIAEKDRIIGHLKGQVKTLDEDISARKKGARLRIIAIIILGILLVLSLTATVAYLSWVLSHPTQGAFQWETSSFY